MQEGFDELSNSLFFDELVVTSSPGELGAAPPYSSLETDFKQSMRNLATSVCVVTIGTGAHATGFTATSVVSLSVDPPVLLVSLNRSSTSWPLVQSSGRFVVNLLSPAHQDIADTFAGRRGLKGHERYVDPRWRQLPNRVPRLTDAVSVIECELEEAIPRYSHAILIGRVVGADSRLARRPLVYWQGGYNQLRE